jgi:hypothetical protein
VTRHEDPKRVPNILLEIVIKNHVYPTGFEKHAIVGVEIMRNENAGASVKSVHEIKKPTISPAD